MKSEKAFKPWLLKIIHNTAVEYIRKNAKTSSSQEIDVAVENDIETKLTLWQTVKSLQQPYRTVTILYYYEDLSISEISKITDTTAVAVKQQLSRAKKTIAGIIEGGFRKMNAFDKYMKEKIDKEDRSVPDIIKERVEQSISELPEKKSKIIKYRTFPKAIAIAACFVFVCLVILPNCSAVYAQALEKIPVIGSIVRVVTIRNYFYSDDYHQMDIDIPKIEGSESSVADYINKDVDELTKLLVDRFNDELEEIGNEGHSGIFVDYEVVTNTEKWFTLKIRVHEAAGSSNTYYRFYHIDKANGKIVELKDLFTSDDFAEVLADNLRKQMKEIMTKDSNKVYWVENAEIGQDFVTLDDKHNFYWDKDGNLVIVFDKYEVAPGSMGTPEFVIEKGPISDILKPEYR